MTEIEEEILENWTNGNLSLLDRHDLIKLVRYFEEKK